jgi:hypothetical protein
MHFTISTIAQVIISAAKWCYPGPLNGSAPNLVVVAHDKKGKAYNKQAFNTDVNFCYKQ